MADARPTPIEHPHFDPPVTVAIKIPPLGDRTAATVEDV